MENEKLIQDIRTGKNADAMKVLYEAYPVINSFIKSHGGSNDDASDTFQESLLIFYKNVQKPDFKLTAAVSTYLFSVCKYLWKDELKKKNRIVDFEVQDFKDEVYEYNRDELESHWLDKILNSLGDKCLQILQLFYYQKLSMEQIAKKLNYKNVDTVKTQKYKCLERAKQMAKEQNLKSVNDIL